MATGHLLFAARVTIRKEANPLGIEVWRLESQIDLQLAKAPEAVNQLGRSDFAQYHIGKLAGLNAIGRLIRNVESV